MKIKHFAGYGCVNATKIKKETVDGITTLGVDVVGNHEWGLVRNDVIDLKRWLVDRFDKKAKDIPYWEIDYQVWNDFQYEVVNGVERVVYMFTYPSGV